MSAQRKRRRVLRVIVGSLVAVVFVALVIYRSFHTAGYRCEVCITFGGHQACRIVEGATESEATASAVNNACAVLAAGVTETLACERTVPDHLKCEPIE